MDSLPLSSFVQTTVALQVVPHLKMAHQLGWMTSVQGPPGIGKTTAIQEYARQTRMPVWYFAASRSTASFGNLVAALARSFAGTMDHRKAENSRSIAFALEATMDRVLIVIDEAQHLRPDALEELRSIHDATGCAIVFVGNHSFLDGHGHELVNLLATPQFKSRLVAPLELRGVETADAEAIARALGVPAATAKRLALKAAKGRMGLRIIPHTVQLAAACMSGPSVTAADYETAIEHLN